MPEKKPYNRYEADKKYNDANARRYGLKFIIKHDADIIAELDRQPSVNGYIKRLIREDLARRGLADPDVLPDEIELTDPDDMPE